MTMPQDSSGPSTTDLQTAKPVSNIVRFLWVPLIAAISLAIIDTLLIVLEMNILPRDPESMAGLTLLVFPPLAALSALILMAYAQTRKRFKVLLAALVVLNLIFPIYGLVVDISAAVR